jgi:hypothetical protein
MLGACSPAGVGSGPPVELASQLAGFEAAIGSAAPTCTTLVGPQMRFENCTFMEEGRLRCFRSRVFESDSTVGETSYWYEDHHPRIARTWRRKPPGSRGDPFRETGLEVYFDPTGHVVWAGTSRDGKRTAIVERRRVEWLERNILKAAQQELDTAERRPVGS